MATVYLHIGLPKTGTTALQIFLYDNQDVLESHGVSFPDFGLRYKDSSFRKNGRFLIAPNISNGTKDFSRPSDEYEPTLNKIAELGKTYDKILITDEGIWHLSMKREHFWSDLKSDFESRGLDLKVIVYLRRQDSFVQSLYAQRVRETKKPFTFEEYLNSEVQKWPLDFKERLDHISDIVGRDALIIRLYEKAQYQGPEHTLFSDFLDIFGLTIADGFRLGEETHHPSLDGTYLELKRLLNFLPENIKGSALHKSLFEMLKTNPTVQPKEKTTRFQSGKQQIFLNQFALSNSQVAREYLGREDGKLFYEEVPDLPQEQISTEALLKDSLIIYGRTLQQLDQQNRELQKRLEKLEAALEAEKNKGLLQHVKGLLRNSISKKS